MLALLHPSARPVCRTCPPFFSALLNSTGVGGYGNMQALKIQWTTTVLTARNEDAHFGHRLGVEMGFPVRMTNTR